MKVGIIVAMDSEYSRLSALLGGAEGTIGHNQIVLRRSGIGKVNAAIVAIDLIYSTHPDCIISTGVAGGLGSDVHVMDIVASQSIVYHDVWCGEGNEYGQVQGLPPRFDSPEALLSCAMSSLGPNAHGGLICSGDQFITDRDEERAILKAFPEALAVDMESAALAQVCHLDSIPFISIRIISDALCEDGADHQKQYDDFWKTVGDNSFDAIRNFLESLPSSL